MAGFYVIGANKWAAEKWDELSSYFQASKTFQSFLFSEELTLLIPFIRMAYALIHSINLNRSYNKALTCSLGANRIAS